MSKAAYLLYKKNGIKLSIYFYFSFDKNRDG